MNNRERIIETAIGINTETKSNEVMMMTLILRVLLDIRDQNDEILKNKSKDWKVEIKWLIQDATIVF